MGAGKGEGGGAKVVNALIEPLIFFLANVTESSFEI